jgi:hypothetical protein
MLACHVGLVGEHSYLVRVVTDRTHFEENAASLRMPGAVDLRGGNRQVLVPFAAPNSAQCLV